MIDYLHCPLEAPVHPKKTRSLRPSSRSAWRRCWPKGARTSWPTPVEAPREEYRYPRRQVRIEPGPPAPA